MIVVLILQHVRFNWHVSNLVETQQSFKKGIIYIWTINYEQTKKAYIGGSPAWSLKSRWGTTGGRGWATGSSPWTGWPRETRPTAWRGHRYPAWLEREQPLHLQEYTICFYYHIDTKPNKRGENQQQETFLRFYHRTLMALSSAVNYF